MRKYIQQRRCIGTACRVNPVLIRPPLCLAPSKDFQTLLPVIYKVMTIVHKQAYGRFPMGGHVTKRFLALVNRRRLLRLLAGT